MACQKSAEPGMAEPKRHREVPKERLLASHTRVNTGGISRVLIKTENKGQHYSRRQQPSTKPAKPNPPQMPDTSYLPDHLTDEQRAIITAGYEHSVITAVAGSGKTSTLAWRIGHLLQQGHDPDRMLVLMFNRSARIR